VHTDMVQLLQQVCPHGDDVTQFTLWEEVVAGILLNPRPVADEGKPSCRSVWHADIQAELGKEFLYRGCGCELHFLCECVVCVSVWCM